MVKRPQILVTNDDGIMAPGIRSLIEVARTIGDVVVVAPDSPQSGMGHAITIMDPIRLRKVDYYEGLDAYECSGTPVDCVKLAKDKIYNGVPDICVSGINHGSNSSINVIYSGTMSAAVEAAIEGIPAIGFSLLDYSFSADFSGSKHFADLIIRQTLKTGLPEGTLLNVNIPKLKTKEINGVKICRQSVAKWEEDYDERIDPMGRKYYWLKGQFVNHDHGEDTDEWALKNGFVSVVPTQFDMTAHHAINHINNKWSFDVFQK